MNITRLIFIIAQNLSFVWFKMHPYEREKKARKKEEMER